MAQAGPATSVPHVQIAEGPEFRWAVLAIDGAAKRLAVPQCQRLLSDFETEEGRTLQASLAASGFSLDDQWGRLWFLSGDGQRPCRSRATSAFTVPGGRVVFLCPTVFRRPVTVHDQLLVIHEFLHTLGLGENPPSSDAITRQVARRCL